MPGLMKSASLAEFEATMEVDAGQNMKLELDRLVKTSRMDQEVERKKFGCFENLFERYLFEKGKEVEWDKIQPLPKEAVVSYANLVEKDMSMETMRSLLNKLIVIKLNGGLGTSMGCQGPKSIIAVRSDQTFLDLTVQQISHLNKKFGVDVPLVLMNSFNTEDDTEKVLKKYKNHNVKIRCFNQNRFPRINKESLTPVAKSMSPFDNEAWYPPGHGDFYQAFHDSGLVPEFTASGKEFCFISNIDNLGATVDLHILNYMVLKGEEFILELTDKTRADVKGGTIISYEKRLRLLEVAQVPKDRIDEFKNVSKFKVFNTNNLWVNLKAVEHVIEEGDLAMDVIVNPKTMKDGTRVIQLEQAIGAAIASFPKAVGVNVPRTRFLPVKTTSDLLVVMSSLYDLRHGTLSMSDKRGFTSVPLVKLGTSFKKVKEYQERFESVPDCIELDHLTVSGDVWFGKGVVLRGTVIIIAPPRERIDIPPGSILENKIVSGNLRILDH